MIKWLAKTSTWTALITPFTPDGGVDVATLIRLMKRQQEASNGILLLGSTGESLSLSDKERLLLLDSCLSRRWSVPIMVGAGGFQLKVQVEWVQRLSSYPIQALLLPTPIYLRPGPHGQMHWFQALLDSAELPCMLYNIPHRAGCSLAAQAVEALSQHERFWALKEGSGDLAQALAYREAAPQLPLYVGSDPALMPLMREGAAGIVSVVGNAWPEETHRIVEQLSRGAPVPEEPWTRAAHLANRNNPVSIKTLLHLQGEIPSNCVRPPLSQEDITHHEELLACDEAMRAALTHQVTSSIIDCK